MTDVAGRVGMNRSNRMKLLFPWMAVVTLNVAFAPLAAVAEDSKPAQEQVDRPVAEQLNTLCPISGRPVDPRITVGYEDLKYAFADEASRTKFNEARKNSLYQRLGGKAAIDAAVEAFYVKVLADDRIKHFFDDINMSRQRRKQKEFLSAALGGPIPWTGKDLRRAHAHLPGLNETHFNAVAENLQKTLEELKVRPELIREVMAIAASTRNDVLNRPPAAK